ncbi:ORF6C domain-containing protein [Bacillus mycoides]|uniref:ORF6C domain-containing protein n=1 Tax=Bacillus mycoides TaxID=1405 RepID=UPI0001A05696|nr:ORF6C domain-containing protein [Bacillus mycoides]EEL04202.1 Antirepressor [Bacillus cereus BDRD-ST196]MCQ6569554.1 ORF6C domain-containing protein [Bacillus mycoides]GAE39997.1 putative phage antirepressor protein [Bacillus mycoides NBRC 101238 = DSM 11821]HDR7592105.1 ORF6C domain-containing protein [Bacillus mycoides]
MDRLTVTNELHILGKQNIAGYQFTGIEGGFGEGKKAMLVKEIAVIHGQPLKEINRRINDNQKRFKAGIDIIDLKNGGSEPPLQGGPLNGLLENLGFSNRDIAISNNIYILSERGYAKLLKILEDDTAWELYDQFVDGYFNMREQKQIPNDPMSILKLTFEAMEGQKQEIQHIKTDVKDLRENAPLFAIECDEISNAVKRCGVTLLGGKNSNAYRDSSVRDKVYKDIYRQLRRHFDVKSYKAIKRRYLEAAKNIVAEYELPMVLSEEITFANSQINMAEVQ